MEKEPPVDYYETLQISANAEPETVHRVYRLLAQRFHPDNAESGNATRFRLITEAYEALGTPEKRAQYDVAHQQVQKDRWRLAAKAAETDTDFGTEQAVRMMVLEVLLSRRRLEPNEPGVFISDLEKLTGQPREHLEFTTWYLVQKKLIQRTDSSLLAITADGVEHLEAHYDERVKIRRLRASNE
jgi:curved DNA-binding protein CbpA